MAQGINPTLHTAGLAALEAALNRALALAPGSAAAMRSGSSIQRPPLRTRAPRSTRVLTTSSTKKGLPSVSR